MKDSTIILIVMLAILLITSAVAKKDNMNRQLEMANTLARIEQEIVYIKTDIDTISKRIEYKLGLK